MHHALPSYFTLLSFSKSLGWFMLMSSIVFPPRGRGDRWEVSWGGGLTRYWTLGVALTEKNLEPGGALLKSSITGACQGLFTQHTHNLTNFVFAGILLFVYKQGGLMVYASLAQAQKQVKEQLQS